MQTKEELLKRLEASERLTELFLNTKKEPRLLNRIKKFWAKPYKFLYHNAYKWGLHHREFFPMETFWGDTLLLPLSDENNITLYYCKSLSESECRLARFFIKHLKPTDVFYDVGANFGFFGFLAHALNVREVHLFEPGDAAMASLRTNAHHGMQLNEAAVSDKEGVVEFYDLSESHKGQMSSLFADFIPEKNRATQRVLKVPALTLDSYIKTHTPPTVIKMDIENSEYLALTGAKELLHTHAPLIAMECMDAPAHIERTKKALALLKEAGYIAFTITPEGELASTDLSDLGHFGEYNERVFMKL